MARSAEMSHRTGWRKDFATRMKENGVEGAAAENVAHGAMDPEKLFRMWMDVARVTAATCSTRVLPITGWHLRRTPGQEVLGAGARKIGRFLRYPQRPFAPRHSGFRCAAPE